MCKLELSDLSLPEAGSTVAVGMSGGVDSTLVAELLRQRGCKVVGITMSMWRNDGYFPTGALDSGRISGACFGPSVLENIRQCHEYCKSRDIEYHVVDVAEQYRHQVLDYYKAEYKAGRTPNPCVRCNATIKFGALLNTATANGIHFDYFCTGHYSRLVRPITGLWESNNRPILVAMATDPLKDQSYFLNAVPSDIWEKVRFPLSKTNKTDNVHLATELGLKAAQRKESQDFASPDDLTILLDSKQSTIGNFVDESGKVLGRHRGIEYYTVGQRRGLGVAVGHPIYVKSIDSTTNRIVLADESSISTTHFIVKQLRHPGTIPPPPKFEAQVKIRLAAKPVPCEVTMQSNNTALVTTLTPVKAVTPGQSAVFYQTDAIIASGLISN